MSSIPSLSQWQLKSSDPSAMTLMQTTTGDRWLRPNLNGRADDAAVPSPWWAQANGGSRRAAESAVPWASPAKTKR